MKKDPFELNDVGQRKQLPFQLMDVILDINTFFTEELQKGFEFPVTGKMNGKLFKYILSFLNKQDRVNFLIQTGRLTPFSDNQSRINMIGHLGTDWCPTELDYTIFEKMYYDSQAASNDDLVALIDLHLWDGYGPDGLDQSKWMAPKLPLSQIAFQFSERKGLYWNDPVDDW